MTEIEKMFSQDDNIFTIFVVAQKFAVNKGYEYFHSFINKENYITTEEQVKNYFFHALELIEKNVAPVSKLIEIFRKFSTLNITDAISSLCKIFTVHEHQVAGPHVIDPIILQEGKITKRAINRLININKDSILQPTIIILLKDNDFKRAKELLSDCPDGINIKTIDGGGNIEIYKVINCGANDIDSFITSFSDQCYSTCSKTKRDILLNEEWAGNSIITNYAPLLMNIRTNLLFDQKDKVRPDLDELSNKLSNLHSKNDNDEKILRSFECIIKLFKVFCDDYGGQSILDASNLSKSLNNEILNAQVYQFAEFLPNTTLKDRKDMYLEGYKIFKNNTMMDHAIYCKNNMLIEQFYSENIDPEEFRALQSEAITNVPGLVGLSHIYNNVGVAYLYCGRPELAIDFFEKGLNYAKYQDRIVQNLALESNKMVAERYLFTFIDENRIRILMRRIFEGMGTTRMPFLSVEYVLNILVVSYSQNLHLGNELIHSFPIVELINNAFSINQMGSGERCLQLLYLKSNYPDSFPFWEQCKIPVNLSETSGKKAEFIIRYGYSLAEFNTWL